jgi:hypothetical protein
MYTLVQALRPCTGRTAHRGNRGIALPFLDHGTRRGWGVSVTPRPILTPRKDPVPIVQEAGQAPGITTVQLQQENNNNRNTTDSTECSISYLIRFLSRQYPRWSEGYDHDNHRTSANNVITKYNSSEWFVMYSYWGDCALLRKTRLKVLYFWDRASSYNSGR